MNIRISLIAAVAVLASACTNQATGQKGNVTLKNNMDSVSYGIGTDIGHNLRQGGFDTLNIEAMAAGIKDGRDSTQKITSETTRSMVQKYMLAAQQKAMAKQRADAEGNIKKSEEWLAENGKRPGVITTASGLQYEVVTMGTGPKPTINDVVKAHYRGSLIDGTEFESSYKKGQPAELPVSNWIPGFVEVFQLMPKGSKWKVYVPQNLAYGAQSPGPSIPPYSALVFDLELVDISAPPAGGGGATH
jgi:FKBP-type peptidyl-prolyl cis-trans isomerase FklB